MYDQLFQRAYLGVSPLIVQILQVPRKYPRVEESESSGYPSRYPVALLPNQYSDYYQQYSAEELRTLPVRTVLELPPKVQMRH